MDKFDALPRSKKIDAVLELLERAFPEIQAHSGSPLSSIQEKLGEVQSDEEFYLTLPDAVQGDDGIFLAKHLLSKVGVYWNFSNAFVIVV